MSKHYIYHITTPEAWADAQQAGAYRHPSLDDEGFIHASELEQVLPTADRHYRGVGGLLLLQIDPDRIDVPLRYEIARTNGESYPHIYGALSLKAVVGVADFPLQGETFSMPQAFSPWP
jgi:uncharacterized protein (DUF952 family)